MSKKALKKAKILGVKVNSTSFDELLRKIVQRIEKRQKTLVVTPNPEFMVYAQEHHWFKKILNSAHFAIPDGFGLILAGRVLGQPIKARITGADLAASLLEMAQEKNWSVGVMGARRGMEKERKTLIKGLQARYPQAKIVSLEDKPDWEKQPFELIFACQGMGKQEKWLAEKYRKSKALVFMGVGGSLDFLTGFSRRAPLCLRKIGLEWFWRGLRKPAHFKRIWRAVFKYGGLVLLAVCSKKNDL